MFNRYICSGPCNASKPQVEALAAKYAADPTLDLRMAIIYEHNLGDEIMNYGIRAFPTYVLYQGGKETARVQGANVPALQQMIEKGNCKAALTGGSALGGGSVAMSAAEARAARLAKLGGDNSTNTTTTTTSQPMDMDQEDTKPPAEASPPAAPEPMQEDTPSESATDTPADEPQDPTAKLDPALVQTLTESMGFSLIRAQKGLLYGNGGTVEAAVDWLMQHQDDDDIDQPIPPGPIQKAQSYKCNECGKILSNMANLELHANKTGHSDFEESTQSVIPLTEEEKKAKIAEIKELLRLKRAEREEAEKVDDVTREKQRRNMGKEMAKTREQMDMEARKREAQQRKREKEAFKKERARLRAELAKDKAERASNKGKLQSRLGVEGYQPDGIQYDVPTGEEEEGGAAATTAKPEAKKFKADSSKIDEYIKKV